MELGNMGEWAGAAAAVIGTLISLFALQYAKTANKLSIQSEKNLANRLEQEEKNK